MPTGGIILALSSTALRIAIRQPVALGLVSSGPGKTSVLGEGGKGSSGLTDGPCTTR